MIARVTVACLAFAIASTGSAASVDPWGRRADADLHAIHDLIATNHPGPVDPYNPSFRRWLEQGLSKSLRMARGVRSEADFRDTLNYYVAGFRDGHIAVEFSTESTDSWPGFLTATDSRGVTRVATGTGELPVPVGTTLEGCDNVPAARLLRERIYRIRANPDIPSSMTLLSAELMITPATERGRQFRFCQFDIPEGRKAVQLHWRPLGDDDAYHQVRVAQGSLASMLGLNRMGDVWIIGIPSFSQSGNRAAKLAKLIEDLNSHAGELRLARHVVIDVRGNGGGNSEWGVRIAEALWGKEATQDLIAGFGSKVDWRVTPRNIATVEGNAADADRAQLPDDAAQLRKLAAGMTAALAQGKTFYREAEAIRSAPRPNAKPAQFAHDIYFVTDNRCASACLSFADIALRMPGVVQIGLPTGADSVYMDIAEAKLPAGKVSLLYGMKVYRDRVRGNNVGYQPKVLWQTGVMSDAAITQWVATLP